MITFVTHPAYPFLPFILFLNLSLWWIQTYMCTWNVCHHVLCLSTAACSLRALTPLLIRIDINISMEDNVVASVTSGGWWCGCWCGCYSYMWCLCYQLADACTALKPSAQTRWDYGWVSEGGCQDHCMSQSAAQAGTFKKLGGKFIIHFPLFASVKLKFHMSGL